MLGYSVHSDGWIYPLHRADMSQRLAYVPFPADGTYDSLLNDLRVRGLEWLFVVGTPNKVNESVAAANQCVQVGRILKSSDGIHGSTIRKWRTLEGSLLLRISVATIIIYAQAQLVHTIRFLYAPARHLFPSIAPVLRIMIR